MGLAVIEKDVDKLQQVILSEVRSELEKTGISTMYSERIKNRNNSLTDGKEYCQGFNDCLAEHNAIMKEIEDIILMKVQLAMENVGIKKGERND